MILEDIEQLFHETVNEKFKILVQNTNRVAWQNNTKLLKRSIEAMTIRLGS